MKLRWTYLLAALTLGLGISLAAACGGGGKEEEEAAPPAATAVAEEEAEGEETAQPEEEEAVLTAPAAAFAELESYRYLIRLSIEGAVAEEGPLDLGEGAFAFDVEGAFVAPDRNRVEVSGNFGGLDLAEESITIGDRSWVRTDGTWEEGQATFGTSDFSPASFLQGFDADELRVLKPTRETVNGVSSLRYKISRADIEKIASLGAFFGEEAGLKDLPENFDIDLWLAEDGKWPVRLLMSATGAVEGGEIDFQFSMDVTDVNDKGIKIEPPT